MATVITYEVDVATDVEFTTFATNSEDTSPITWNAYNVGESSGWNTDITGGGISWMMLGIDNGDYIIINGFPRGATYYARMREVVTIDGGTPTVGINSNTLELHIVGTKGEYLLTQLPVPAMVGAEFSGMEVYNHAAHLGYSRSPQQASKWIGKVTKKQFGTDAPTEHKVFNAELEIPNGLPHFHKVVCLGDYYYAIEWQGTKIYKVKVADGTFTVSEDLFNSAQAICAYYYLDTTVKYKVMVLDYQGLGAPPVLNMLIADNTSTAAPILDTSWGTTGKIYIPGFGEDGNFMNITDMEWSFAIDGSNNRTSSKLYIVAGYEKLVTELNGPNWIFSLSKTGVEASEIFYNITPKDPSWYTISRLFTVIEDRMEIWMRQGISSRIVMSFSDSYTGILLVDRSVNPYAHEDDGTDITYRYIPNTGNNISGPFDVISTVSSVYEWVLSVVQEASSVVRLEAFNCDELTASGYIEDTNDPALWSETVPMFTTARFTNDIASVISDKLPQKTQFNITLKSVGSSYGLGLFLRGTANTNSFSIKNVKFTTASKVFAIDSPAEIASSGIELAVTKTAGISYFKTGMTYFYTYSLEYDGIQESPLYLGAYATIVHPALPVGTPPTYINSVSLKVNQQMINGALSRRVTAFKIYIAEANGETATEPETLFRLVEVVDIEEGWSFTTPNYVKEITDTGLFGSSYEAETGISQTLTRNYVNYEIDTQFQGYHFVARCYVPGIDQKRGGVDDASRMLFRSKQDCFDQFDWSNDFCMLPKIPTAIVAYNGSIFVYAENESYRINPIGLYVEDIYEGIGVPCERSLCVTEMGMFLCNRDNIYYHDGKNLAPIGTPIRTIVNPTYAEYGWVELNKQVDTQPIAVQFLKQNTIMFAVVGAEAIQGYAFNYLAKRFDYWQYSNDEYVASNGNQFEASKHNGWFADKTGQVYVASGNSTPSVGIISLASSSTRKPFTWESKYFTMEVPDQLKKFYAINVNDDTATITVDHDGSYDEFADFTPSRWKTMIIRIVGLATTQILNISLQFRKMIGVR